MQISPQKHVRLSPRPSTSFAPYPSPTYTSAIAAAQHSVNVALGLQNSGGFTGSPGTNNIRASSSITILNNNNNNSMHHSQSTHNAHHLQQVNPSEFWIFSIEYLSHFLLFSFSHNIRKYWTYLTVHQPHQQRYRVPHQWFIVHHCHQIVGHAVKIKSVENNMAWKRKNYGVHNVNGRKHAAVLATENDQNRQRQSQQPKRRWRSCHVF